MSVREPPAPTAPPAERRPERGKRPWQASRNAGTLGTTSWGLILVIAVKLGDGWSEGPSSPGFTCASKRRHSPLSGGSRTPALQPAVRRPGLLPRVWASPLRPAARGRGTVSALPTPRPVGVSPRDWRGCSLVCAVVSPFFKKGKQLFSESRAVLVTDGSTLRNVSDRQRCVTLSSLLCPLLRTSALRGGGKGRPGAFRSGAKLAHVARGWGPASGAPTP